MKKLTFFLGFGGAICSMANGQTESNAGDFNLDLTVVTASRVEQSVGNVSQSVAVLESSELIRQSVRTVPEAFAEIPGVRVQKTTHGHGSPFIRGFTGRQNLLLVDGVRMNNSAFRSGPIQTWNTLDSQAVQRLELVKGPGSVLYGSDAIGGVLNVISEGTGFEDYEGLFQHGSLYYRFDKNSESHVGRLEQAIGRGGEWGLKLGLSLKDFGDIRDSGVGVMKNTGYPEQAFDLKFERAFGDSKRLTLAHQFLNQDEVWRWHSTTFNQGWTHGSHQTAAGNNNVRFYDQERSLTYVRLSDSDSSGWFDAWEGTLSFQKAQDSQYRVRDSFTRIDETSVDVETWGLSIQGERAFRNNLLVTGVDYYHDEVDSAGSRNGAERPSARPVADDSRYDSIGIFAQWEHEVNDRFRAIVGARASYFKASWDKYSTSTSADPSAELSGSSDWTNLSFSLRGIYDVNDELSFFGGASQGFRAPNLDDLTGSSVANANILTVGSTDVDPEKFISFELGSRYSDGRLRAELTGFFTLLDDPITRADIDATGTEQRIVNGRDGHVGGVELASEFDLSDQWLIRLQATYQDGKVKSEKVLGGVITEDTLRRLSPISGSVEVKWTHPSDAVWVSGVVRAAATQDNLAAGDAGDDERVPSGGTPSYMIPSIRAGWQVNDDFLLTLALENLTDEDYRVHGSGVNEPGFNTIIGMQYTW